jgi:hypothetical protein
LHKYVLATDVHAADGYTHIPPQVIDRWNNHLISLISKLCQFVSETAEKRIVSNKQRFQAKQVSFIGGVQPSALRQTFFSLQDPQRKLNGPG